MNQIRILIILSFGFLLWKTFITDFDKSALLSNTLHTVDNNPKEALTLLENISPEYLYDYDKDQYMQFVVTLTQARYMDYQDITGDSLILDAQRYFARSQNYEMAARASYYAAAYWYEGEVEDKAMEYWQAALYFAEKAGNGLFMAKSAYSLGRSYFIQEQWEDALPYCQKALALYNDQPDPEHYKLVIVEMLGQIFRRLKDPEQAYRYFEDGLEAAKKLNDINYESRFLRKIGTIYYDKGEYQLAKEYFDQALTKQPEPEDRIRIYISYAKLYRDMNLPDSARHYLYTIENQIDEIIYPNTRRDIYAELATYYNSDQGDGEKLAHYLQLANKEDLRIKKSQSQKKINAINQQIEQLKQKKQTEGQTYRRLFNFGLVAICLLVSLLVLIWFNKGGLKDNCEYIKSADDLYQKELAYTAYPIWEQQLVLSEKFRSQLAGHTRKKLEKLHNGSIALSKLAPEDLPFILLVSMKYPDEEVGRWLGYKEDTKEAVKLRKEQIRRILSEAGISDENIKDLLP